MENLEKEKGRSLYLPKRVTKVQVVKTFKKEPQKSFGFAMHLAINSDIGSNDGIQPVIVLQFAGFKSTEIKNGEEVITLKWNTKSGFWIRDIFGLFDLRMRFKKIALAISEVEKNPDNVEKISEKINACCSLKNPKLKRNVNVRLSYYKNNVYVNLSFSDLDPNAANSAVNVNLSSDEFINFYQILDNFVNNFFIIASNISSAPTQSVANSTNAINKPQYNKDNKDAQKNEKFQEKNIKIDEEDLDFNIDDDIGGEPLFTEEDL